MLASKVNLKELTTSHDCLAAISKIEGNYRNYDCTLQQWNSGQHCELKQAAKLKIKAIENRLFSFPD